MSETALDLTQWDTHGTSVQTVATLELVDSVRAEPDSPVALTISVALADGDGPEYTAQCIIHADAPYVLVAPRADGRGYRVTTPDVTIYVDRVEASGWLARVYGVEVTRYQAPAWHGDD